VSGQPDTDTTTYSFEIDGLYYIANNLGLGLILQYENSEIERGGVDIDSSSLLIGPQVTYNFPLNDKVSLFVNAAVGYAEAEVEDADADGWGWKVGAGLKYFLTNSASINGVVSYKALSLEDDSDNDFDEDGVSVGIGLSIYF
jgi:opacity protein-like surface antigen